MTLTTHALVGAAAASIFPNHPYMAFTAAFASHFAIDAIPHWDYEAWLRSVVKDPAKPLETDMRWSKEFINDLAIIGADAIIGTIASLAVFNSWMGIAAPIVLIGAWAGIFPDFLQFIYCKMRTIWVGALLLPLQKFHQRLQAGKHRYHWGALKGLGLQLAIIIAAVWTAYLAHF